MPDEQELGTIGTGFALTWEQKLVRYTINGFVWAGTLLLLCFFLGINEPVWKLLIVVLVMIFVAHILDVVLPTESKTKKQ